MTDITRDLAERAFQALGEHLAARGSCFELVIIGGSALLALDVIGRPTSDVDLLALRHEGELVKPDPMPPDLVEAARRVGRDLALPADWLNAGPASLLDYGLPQGFMERLETRRYGSSLAVHFASRRDQIHFKLYAAVDQGAGKHASDLQALAPSGEELVDAARWARTHDTSPAFRSLLEGALRHLGVEDADLGA